MRGITHEPSGTYVGTGDYDAAMFNASAQAMNDVWRVTREQAEYIGLKIGAAFLVLSPRDGGRRTYFYRVNSVDYKRTSKTNLYRRMYSNRAQERTM